METYHLLLVLTKLITWHHERLYVYSQSKDETMFC
jgi:hypothetical protein